MNIALKCVRALVVTVSAAALAACGASHAGALRSPSVSIPVAPASGAALTAAQVKAVLSAAAGNMTTLHEAVADNVTGAGITAEGDLSVVNGTTLMQLTAKAAQIGTYEVRRTADAIYFDLPFPGLGG